ncbi:hypothetical protein CN514_00775 [Bacillus sp. AFS001701]|uniref:hypothetical protein n=1 Tax=Bacillus sp. AFS001701 TaxID=2033480 RepID=UPI000BF3ABA6|nr:hypothetical protein [Bacillus sp. AFS001701]PET77564.1 hypothetical protein CN514_00775 [Bacillus sp. AFS001701]
MARVMKGVSFNTDDEFDKKLLNYIEKRGMFSKVIKRLIEKEMNGVINSKVNVVTAQIEQKEIDLPKQVELPVKKGPSASKFI